MTGDPRASARAASCRYVDDAEPGIRRLRAGKGFRYVDARGKPVRDLTTLNRIRKLAIPPAWERVWICPVADGHVQATGRDARGRKQYRYHPRFREIREETKFAHVLAFAEALPAIRRRVDRDLGGSALSREKVLATVVRLLEATLIRVGNEEYARQNGSFGLTTLRSRHVDVSASTIRFEFRGKSGKRHVVCVTDRRIARVIQRCSDLPGEILFRYAAEDGSLHNVEATSVNDYLREVSGSNFTAKDFRTWMGTVLAASALASLSAEGTRPTKETLVRAIREVSTSLGNTAAVCRKCYVHPEIVEAYFDGSLPAALSAGQARARSLSKYEAAVLALLRDRSKTRRMSSSPSTPSRRAA